MENLENPYFGPLWVILDLLPHSWEKMDFLKKLISASFYTLQLPSHHAKHQKTLISGQQRKLQNDRQTDNHCFQGPSVYQGLKNSISR